MGIGYREHNTETNPKSEQKKKKKKKPASGPF